MKTAILIAGVAVLAIAIGLFVTGRPATKGPLAEVYYSPSCGCCVNYIGHLRSAGFQVKAIQMPDVSELKDSLGIPEEMRSCHTTKIEGYFVEGHVPKEAILKLLAEKPSVDGIALPGMPSGSPGMPGRKVTFEIMAITDSQASGQFMKI